MPLYFFNLAIPGRVVPDLKGHDLPSDEAAERYAIANARELMKRYGNALNAAESTVEVKDAAGTVLFTVPFAIVRDR
jgi:hypothetical protein